VWKRILAVDSDLVVTGSARAKCQGRALEILSVCGIDDDEEVVGAFDVFHAWEDRIARTW